MVKYCEAHMLDKMNSVEKCMLVYGLKKAGLTKEADEVVVAIE